MNDLELWHGDCLTEMGRIADGSVDLIAADLPYGTTACKWDTVIPFEPLWAHYRRVIKPNGAIVLTASQPFTSALVMSNPKWFRYEWVWEKNTGSNVFNATRQPVRYHENIVVFYGDQPTYNREMAPRKESAKGRVRCGILDGKPGTSKHYTGIGVHREKRRYDVDWVNPKSVLYFKAVPNGGGGKLHATQKPVALMEYLIRTYTNPSELVLDNTCGSGTTLIAAMNTGRRAIGIEKDADIFATAEKRIEAARRERSELLIA
jgi:site-specific DNA-methyltransferase (adenine-specific)